MGVAAHLVLAAVDLAAQRRALKQHVFQAEAEALETEHPLPDGGSLAIERTRGLTAIDVDASREYLATASDEGNAYGRLARALRQLNRDEVVTRAFRQPHDRLARDVVRVLLDVLDGVGLAERDACFLEPRRDHMRRRNASALLVTQRFHRI